MGKQWTHILSSLAVVLIAASMLSAANNSWNFPVPTLGGLTTGGLIYARSPNALGNIDAVAAGQVLTSAGTGTIPAYSARPVVSSATLATVLPTNAYWGLAHSETGDAYGPANGFRLYASMVGNLPVVYIRFATGPPHPIASAFSSITILQ